MKFMDGRLRWEGSPSELYSQLLETAKEMGISTRQKAWPKAPNILTRRINELAPALMQLGIEVVLTRTDKTRIITINTVTTVISSSNHENNGKTHDGIKQFSQTPSAKTMEKTVESPLGDGSDDNDGIFHTSSSRLSVGDKLKIVYGKGRELAVDSLFSKFAVADALEGVLDRNEVFKLLNLLEEREGKLIAKGVEWYRVV